MVKTTKNKQAIVIVVSVGLVSIILTVKRVNSGLGLTRFKSQLCQFPLCYKDPVPQFPHLKMKINIPLHRVVLRIK